jgi:enolase-phosphatase E1
LAAPLAPAHVRAILLDIEGTTTPIGFVYQKLFPYARNALAEFLRAHSADADVRADLEALKGQRSAEAAQGLDPPPWSDDSDESRLESVVAYVRWLMDRDSKATALKSLQGRVWAEGYRSGQLRGEVYPDVPAAFARWRSRGLEICIYSSGSIAAQKFLFGHSVAGDLTPYLRAYFDTTTGPKQRVESYRQIASTLGTPPGAILFLSDSVAELEAARAAGVATGLCLRERASKPVAAAHPAIRTFDEVFP